MKNVFIKSSKIQFIFYLLFFIIQKSLPVYANENIYFLTLRNEKVNVRKGPSFDYPIKYVYKKKYLPVVVMDSMEIWRKIKDFKNNHGWIHISQLSKKKTAINTKENSIIFKKPTIYSEPIVKVEKGKLFIVKKCKEKWCKVAWNKHIGWIKKENLWGRI